MSGLISNSKLFVKRNSATILTCMGGAGVVATSVMAVKATPKALQLLEEAEKEKQEELTNLEKVKIAGPAYIPSIVVGASTIVCIFGANALNKRQQAALTSAYGLINSSYKEYKNKVKELYGEDAEINVKNEIAKDKYKEADIPPSAEKELFYDEFSGRFFRSTMADVQRAQYAVNRDLVMQSYATINDFYTYLNIPPVDYGDEMGWTPAMNSYDYWQEWVDFSNLKMVDDDGLEYYIIRIFQEPRLGFVNFE